MAPLILRNISKAFSRQEGGAASVLRQVSFTARAGEFISIIGPTGSGKTTLLRIIAGVLAPDEGEIRHGDADWGSLPAAQRDAALVFQGGSLFPQLTVQENLALGLKLRRVAPGEIQARVAEVAASFALEELLARRPETLSAGEYQLVAIARALVRRPKVLMFDEPLAHLDAHRRQELRHYIYEAHKRCGGVTLLVTHDQGEALALADRVALLHHGSLRGFDTPARLYEHPPNRLAAEFIGAPPMNFFHGRLQSHDGTIEFIGEDDAGMNGGGLSFAVPLAGLTPRPEEKKPVVFGLRPEDIHLDTPAGFGGAFAAGTVTVERIEFIGCARNVYLRFGRLRLVARVPSDVPVHPGETRQLGFCLARAHWFERVTGTRL